MKYTRENRHSTYIAFVLEKKNIMSTTPVCWRWFQNFVFWHKHLKKINNHDSSFFFEISPHHDFGFSSGLKWPKFRETLGEPKKYFVQIAEQSYFRAIMLVKIGIYRQIAVIGLAKSKSLVRNISRQIFSEKYHLMPTLWDCYRWFTEMICNK